MLQIVAWDVTFSLSPLEQSTKSDRARKDPEDQFGLGRFYIWHGVQFNTDTQQVIKAFKKYDFIFSKLAFRRDGTAVSAEDFAEAIVQASKVNDSLIQRQDDLSKLDRRKATSFKK